MDPSATQSIQEADYVLPVSKDMPGSDELFDEVMFVELNREESQRRLDEMQDEVSNLNSNSSSLYSCRNCVQSYPFSPNYGECPVWSYPITSSKSILTTGSWSISYSSVPPNYQYHMLNQVNTYWARAVLDGLRDHLKAIHFHLYLGCIFYLPPRPGIIFKTI
ncbi:hypothetical protein M0R45_027628 [Rubus argutus]|uniref:Uncharacterized protein n=1 Tax=Rubus argutus TaxID=59490 RepID=A0AAW1X139_RUBAR